MGNNCSFGDCMNSNSPQIKFEKGEKVLKFDLNQENTSTNFQRSSAHHNTINQIRLSEANKNKLMKSFENSSNSTYNSNGNDKMEKVKSSSKFKRKDKNRS